MQMNLKRFVAQCKRVLKIATKPTKEEYMASLKIISLAIGILGSIGFTIYLIMHFILKAIGV